MGTANRVVASHAVEYGRAVVDYVSGYMDCGIAPVD